MGLKPLSLFATLLLMVTAACSSASIPGGDAIGGHVDDPEPEETNGAQTAGPQACSAGKTKCEAECVDLKTATNHCGACGSPCAGGTTCQNGFCSSEGSCAADKLSCGSKCIDPQVDNANCGACGNTCGDAGACLKGGCPGELRVRALIDGQSQLVLTGAKMKWHVVRAAAPGRWNGHNDATLINATAWMPVWPATGDNRDCNCDSQPSPDVSVPLKGVEQTVTLKKIEGRGSVSITEQPSAANGYTLKVDYSDPPGGAAWFEIVLTYSSGK
jgi:Stigma-specific protein, Stig1